MEQQQEVVSSDTSLKNALGVVVTVQPASPRRKRFSVRRFSPFKFKPKESKQLKNPPEPTTITCVHCKAVGQHYSHQCLFCVYCREHGHDDFFDCKPVCLACRGRGKIKRNDPDEDARPIVRLLYAQMNGVNEAMMKYLPTFAISAHCTRLIF